MKKIFFAAALLCMMSCQNKNTEKVPGIDLTSLDTSVAPSESFYQYATGGWQAKNPLKPEFSRYGSFDKLREDNEKRINLLFQEMADKKTETGTVEQKIADLYKMGLDSVRRNNEGAAPIQADLQRILSIENLEQLSDEIAYMHLRIASPFFSFGPSTDMKNSSMHILYVGQAGIGMGNRDYYLDEENAAIREAYRNYLSRVFALAGLEEARVTEAVEAVMKVETEMARNRRSNVEMRDVIRLYNPMSIDELKALCPSVDWDKMLNIMQISTDRVNVAQPEYIEAVGKLIATAPIEELRYYLASQYITSAADHLSDDFYAASFDFFSRTLTGAQEMRPRWKRAMEIPNYLLGEAVGEIYVQKFFTPEDKARMTELVANLQEALSQHIDNLAWMSDETKARAQEKLATFRVKIGYPDEWKDYSSLAIDPTLSYWENLSRASEWATLDQMKKVDQPVDRDEWLMSPQTVNAYYNPTTNEICFPAAILQPPFFNRDADDAVNYGAIGVVIGHEMTHGFDDQGRQFDKDGNMNNWWTEADSEAFKQRTDILRDQFNAIEVLPARDGQPALYADGQLSLGENIADQGGLRVAYTAFRNSLEGAEPAPIDGFTAAQRFYLAYAALWGQNIRDEEIARLTKVDVHSLGRLRVDATLRNIQEFYDAFGITEGAMFLPVEERVIIW